MPVEDSELFASAVAEEVATPEPTPQPQPSPTPEPPTPADGDGGEPPGEAVPSWRLREVSDARRAAEERAATLEARLNEVIGHARQLQSQKSEEERRKATPDFFEDPKAATEAAVTALIAPFVNEYRAQSMAMSRSMANFTHKEEMVNEAEKAFLTAIQNGSLETADYESVVTAPNRYDAAVRWHKRHKALSTVGDDPEAWFQKQLDERMKDQGFQAKVMESLRSSAPSGGNGITRTSRRIPPSLSGLTTVAGNGVTRTEPMSDESLWSFATDRDKAQ